MESAQNNNKNISNDEVTPHASAAPTETSEAAGCMAFCNQETEKVAMVDELIYAFTPPNTINTTITTATTAIATQTQIQIQRAIAIATATEENAAAAPSPSATAPQTTTAATSLSEDASVVEFLVPAPPPRAPRASSSSSLSLSTLSVSPALSVPMAAIYGNSSLKSNRRSRNPENSHATVGMGRTTDLSGGLTDGDIGTGTATGTDTCTANGNCSGNGTGTCTAGTAVGNASCGNGGNIVASNIKSSVSMTSLPPNEKQQGRDVIKDKMKVERPYNSLKIDRCSIGNSNFGGNSSIGTKQHHRYSWGSAYSQSSSCFNEDFSLSFQTNYNYIMDTNLLDTCMEARCELEGSVNVLENTGDCCFKMLNGRHRSKVSFEDPHELRKWLRAMEQKLETAPSLSETTLFSIAELQRHLAEHSVLYHEIVSHARVVNACIRTASEKEQQQQLPPLLQQEQQQQSHYSNNGTNSFDGQNNSSLSLTDDVTTTTTTGNSGIGTTTREEAKAAKSPATTPTTGRASENRRSIASRCSSSASASSSCTSSWESSAGNKGEGGGNLDHLQNRYHLLYLKAFEVQLWLDGLLRKKTTAAASEYDDEDDDVDVDVDVNVDVDDDIGAATEYDINDVASDLESDITNNSSALSFCDLQRCDTLSTNNNNSNINNKTSNINNNNNTNNNNTHSNNHNIVIINEEDDIGVVDEVAERADAEDLADDNKHNNHNNHNSNNKRSVVEILEKTTATTTTTQATQQRGCIQNKGDCEDGDDEEEDEDEVDFARGGGTQRDWPPLGHYKGVGGSGGIAGTSRTTATLTDFEADSESSDWEIAQSLRRQQQRRGNGDFSRYNNNYASQHPQHHNLQQQQERTAVYTTKIARNTALAASSAAATNNAIIQDTSMNDNNTSNICYLQQQQLQTTTMQTKTMSTSVGVGDEQQHFNNSNYNEKNTTTTNNNNHRNGVELTTATSTTSPTVLQPQQHYHQQQTYHQTVTLHAHNTNTNSNNSGSCNGSNTTTNHSSGSSNSNTTSKQRSIAIISPNCHNNSVGVDKSSNNNINNNTNNKSPMMLRKRHQHHHHHQQQQQQQQHQQSQQKQQRHVDISKFNRSNRKSKNCAIFYFKHLDTDNDETSYGALSSSASHTSDLLKSADASSDDDDEDEDEGWLYSSAAPVAAAASANNNNTVDCLNSSSNGISTLSAAIGGIQSSAVSSSTAAAGMLISDDSDKENKEALLASNGTTTTAAEAATAAVPLHCTASAQIPIAEIQLAATTKETTAAIITHAVSGNSSGNNGCGGCNCDSSSSSNDMITDTTATTTTPGAAATQITQMHCQQRTVAVGGLYRTEMELQINGNHNSTNSTHKKSNLYNNNINCSSSSNNDNIQHQKEMRNMPQQQQHQHQQQQQQQQQLQSQDLNGNSPKDKLYFHTRADICNITVKSPSKDAATMSYTGGHQQFLNIPSKRLPPRSPAKSGKSHKSNDSVSTLSLSPAKGKVSHESIKQLVLAAEHLVRDEALKTPTKQKHQAASLVQISSTVKKREVIMPGPIKQRVQEWLEHQPSNPLHLHRSHDPLIAANHAGSSSVARTDDCEASGEASETDSLPQPGSDTSEGFTDSIATCMQTSTNSYGNSTERIGGSAELPTSGSAAAGTTATLGCASSNQSLNVKILKRPQTTRRKAERPWSVSCLSQLTTDATQVAVHVVKVSDVQAGLASHSISESALDSLSPSPSRPRASSSSAVQVKTCDSKGSLKRRRTRKKKLLSASAAAFSAGKKTDSGSEETAEMPKLTQTLMQSCETMSPQQIHEITSALLYLQKGSGSSSEQLASDQQSPQQQLLLHAHAQLHTQSQPQQQMLLLPQLQQQLNDSDDASNQLMKPIFRVGSYTTAYMRSETRLGSLASLANYMNDGEPQVEYTTGTDGDHHSSFSETAWDNYQEKYNSENYSEGFDSDAARRLMEFGDDYRNFIDSQSDCCSSLSAANNLDSFSPPRMDSLQQNEARIITQDTIASSVDHARRRRALELEYERRRKTLEVRRKSCQDTGAAELAQNPRSPSMSLSSSANALTPKNTDKLSHQQQQRADSANRKLEFGGMMSHSAQSLRRTSESDTSTRRRKADERRRSSRNLEKCIKLIPATSSSSCDDSDDEKEMRNLLQQSRNRLEDTRALKIRCHLLRPEDYNEIINTCRDNIRCLEAVLRGPPGSVLSTQCVSQTKDLLGAWEDLLRWSENAAAARKLQEEMVTLKQALHRLGNKASFELLDTEPSIQIAIDALKSEKTELQTYRTNMLHLNASVHGWLTRQERKLQVALEEQQDIFTTATRAGSSSIASSGPSAGLVPADLWSTSNSDGVPVTVTKEESEQTQSNADCVGDIVVVDDKKQQPAAAVEDDGSAAATNMTTTTTTTITVTDSNGNQLETHSSSVAYKNGSGNSSVSASTSTEAPDRVWDLNTLMSSENEFHKHLKDEVSDMYSAWDEADARINTQLEVLTTSLIAWRQLESGLFEFQQALGQDRGTLKGLEGALNKGQATPVELAQNVKFMAKLLSEKVNVSQEQITAVQEHLDPNHILHIAKFTASNGSLSDSGISDGGTTSDGGLSERERRLGVLRRLAKQLESALAPGSEAMKSIAARMESAEAELKNLQNTCRDLIVRTAATHQNKKQQQQQQQEQQQKQQEQQELEAQQKADLSSLGLKKAHKTQAGNGCLKANGHTANQQDVADQQQYLQQHEKQRQQQQNSPTKRKNKRKQRKAAGGGSAADGAEAVVQNGSTADRSTRITNAADDGDDDAGSADDHTLLEFCGESCDEGKSKRGWTWRIVKAAVPMQLALFTFLLAACLMQPNCCDNLNNLSMSFTPQLRYIRGPPPI